MVKIRLRRRSLVQMTDREGIRPSIPQPPLPEFPVEEKEVKPQKERGVKIIDISPDNDCAIDI